MNKKNRSSILSASARVLLAFVFMFGQNAWASQEPSAKGKPAPEANPKVQQSPATQAPIPAAKSQAAEDEESAQAPTPNVKESQRGGPHEGIKVHGHWTIEVRNPDGSVVTHREFENALTSIGSNFLLQILSLQVTPGGWQVAVCNSGGNFDPVSVVQCVGSGSPFILRLNEQGSGAGCSSTNGNCSLLSVTSTAGTTPQPVLTLSGFIQNAPAGTIDTVETDLMECMNYPITVPVNITPSSCLNSPAYALMTELTGKYLGPTGAVTVNAGQTVAVTVNISFS